jgi:hypothetical protein
MGSFDYNRLDPKIERYKANEEDARFQFETYDWPRIKAKMDKGIEISSNDYVSAQFYATDEVFKMVVRYHKRTREDKQDNLDAFNPDEGNAFPETKKEAILKRTNKATGKSDIVLMVKNKQVKKFWELVYADWLWEEYGIGNVSEKRPYTLDEAFAMNNKDGDEDYLIVRKPEESANNQSATLANQTNSNASTFVGPLLENGNESEDVIVPEIIAETDLNTNTVDNTATTITAATVLEEDPRDKERPLIDIKKGLTEAQKQLFHWDETVKTFKTVNRIDGNVLRTWEFSRWVCMALRDGWKEGDPIPNARVVREVERKNGHPVYEALNYNAAFAHARKNSPTGKFYYVNIITKYELPYASGTGLASASAYKNFQLNKDRKVDFKKIADFVGPDANEALRQLNAIKFYNDKLLSDHFVEIVYNAQIKLWPDKKDKAHWTGLWDSQTETKFNNYPAELKQKQDAEKERVRKQNEFDATVGYDDGNGFRRFVIDGQNRYVEMAVLEKLRKTIKTYYNGADEILEDYKPGNAQFKKDLAFMLEIEEREKILMAYEEEWDVDEEEEEVIVLILTNVPNEQLNDPKLKKLLVKYENKGLKDWIDYNHNIADFQTARESITGEVDKTNTTKMMAYVDFEDDAEDAAEDLNAKLPMLSAQQILAMSWSQRAKCLDIFLQEDGPTDIEDWDYFDRLIINTPIDQVPILKVYLEKENYIRFVRLRDRMPASQNSDINESLNAWYQDDTKAVGLLVKLQEESYPFSYTKEENKLYAFPQTVFNKLNEEQRLNLYARVARKGADVKGHQSISYNSVVHGDTGANYGGKILLKILYSVGARAKDGTERKNQKQNFYDQLSSKEDIGFWNTHRMAYDDNEKNALDRTLNDLDARGRKQRTQEVIKKSFDAEHDVNDSADDLIAELGEADLFALTLSQRKELINAMVGQGGFESFFTRVGDRDEKTILRIINTTPEKDMPDLVAWFGDKTGTVYERLHSAIDGENYDKFHAQFQEKKMKAVAEEKDVLKKEKKEQEIRSIQQTGQKEGIPWDSYSYLGLVFFSSGIEYDVAWTDEGKIHVTYQTRDWKDVYLQPVMPIVRSVQHLFDNGQEYGPYDWVGVYSVEDDEEMGFKEGEVRVMPAINLLRLGYKQDVAHVWEIVDILSLLVGIGEIKAAVSLGRLIVGFIDVIFSVGNMITRTFGHLLPKGWTAGWHEFSMYLATFQLAYLGVNAIRNYKTIWQGLKDGVVAAKNKMTALAYSTMLKLLQKEEEVLDLMVWINTTEDLSGLRKLLKDVEAQKATMDVEAYANLTRGIENRIAALEGRLSLENKLANERKVADEMEGADAERRLLDDVVPVHLPTTLIADSLTGQMRITYEQLVNSGLLAAEEAGLIRFYSQQNKLIAEMSTTQLVFKYSGFGGDIVMDLERTTTVLGKWDDMVDGYGTKEILILPEGIYVRGGANHNGINILDLPNETYMSMLEMNIQKYLNEGKSISGAKSLSKEDGMEMFWNQYNYRFLEDAFQRGDNIRLLSNKFVFKESSDQVGSFFKREIIAIEDGWGGQASLMEKYGYTYDVNTFTYKKK